MVFISGFSGDGQSQNAGLCLTCARELHIPQVDSIMKQFGLSDDNIEAMEDQLAGITSDPDFAERFGFLMNPPEGFDEDDEDEDDFDEFSDEDFLSGLVGEDIAGDDDDEDDEPIMIVPPEKMSEFIDMVSDTEKKAEDSEDAKAPASPALPEEEKDAEEDSDGEDSEDSEEGEEGEEGEENEEEPSLSKRLLSPFEKLFGTSFQPGGTAYADDDKNQKKSRSKGRREKKYKYLDTYCTNLTRKAREGQLDRIIGRDHEIERMVQILSRRQKNNPCLIGEPGVGKTAIAEGLALRIAEGCVPLRLAQKQLFMLDLTALVAGTQYRGQFESRIKGLIDEVKSVGNVILFIDEVHSLVGTGSAEGSMNAANILKPALSRGELQVIGATTYNEYQKHIEKDAALERRFQPIRIEEPSVADAIEVLRGIKDYYEEHHGVTFSDAMIVRAVNLSERYITDRFLPDKAIDLLDEACACAALRNKAKEETGRLTIDLDRAKSQLERISDKSEGAPTESDFQKMAELRTQILRLEQRIEVLRPEAEESDVTESDLAHVIELWTGIPASRVEESEYKRLTGLADRMKEKIKGQDEAVDLVASAIRRNRVQISPRRRPASFIFVGPTGVGKTELVKVLAAELFDTPETLIRLDMSEFMEKHSVSRIIGSPPGYVGYDEAGQLTEKVRRKPYSVLLFDEIEKAHPDVLNILLQILDEGRITDAQGRTVNFENTVVVMTSNAGSNTSSSSLGFGKTSGDIARDKAMKALGDFLRPEFLARVDEVVCFNTLSDKDFAAIARLMCDEYVPFLAERGCELTFEEEVMGWLADRAKEGKSAARDLRSLIRREVEDKLALLLIESGPTAPARITVSVRDGAIAVTAG